MLPASVHFHAKWADLTGLGLFGRVVPTGRQTYTPFVRFSLKKWQSLEQVGRLGFGILSRTLARNRYIYQRKSVGFSICENLREMYLFVYLNIQLKSYGGKAR